jgi:hypothetical protein
MRAQRSSHVVTFPQLQVNQLMKSVSPTSTPSIDCLPVLVQTCSITACKCISELTRSWSPNTPDHGLQVYVQPGLNTVFKLARWRPPSASPNLPACGLQVYLQSRSITASNYISNLAWLQPRSEFLSSRDRHFQAHLELLKHRLQPVQIYHVKMSSYIET